MKRFRSNLSKLTGKTSYRIKPIVKKAFITAFAFSAIAFGGGAAAQAAKEDSLTTVYYVYLNDEFIGTVSDKDVIEEMITTKVSKAKEEYTDYDLTLGSQLTFVPEHVFQSSATTYNEQVVEKLQEQLKVQAEATAIVIDGQPVAYLENPEQAEEVIKTLKFQYVTAEQLQELEERKTAPNASLPPLKENETRLLDVRLSKEVSLSEKKVLPKDVLSVEQAVQLLKKGTLEEKKYKVKEGDVLGSIANDNDLTLKEILTLNPELTEDTVLKIDQEVNITFLKPYVEVIIDKEVFKKETVAYEKEVKEDTSMYKGDTKVQQEGKDGLREVTYRLSEQNGQTVKKETVSEKIIQEPVKYIVLKGTKVIPSRGDGSFVWPTVGGYVSSQMGYRWGKMHKGIDIARPSNRTIMTIDNGVVVSAGWDGGGYGNKVIIDHGNGYRSVYAHLDSITVSNGQTVPKGTQIGVMGNTGDSTGVHLHLELYKNGSLVNPLTYIR
jgi:murein DD-endopeptidase MepM/ murein hydrolase activator NlpD